MISQNFWTRLLTATFAVFALMNVCAPSLVAQGAAQSSYMPILQATDAADLGLALSNPTLAEVTVTLTARDYSGAAISGAGITNPATITLPPSGQRALRAVEIFGSGIAGKTGWVQLQSTSVATKGFFLVFDSRVSFIDGAELQTRPASRIIYPKVSSTAASPTIISFVHTGSETIPFAALSLYDNSGTLTARTYLSLAPRSGFSGPITALIPEAAGFDGYAVLETTGTPFSSLSETLVGFETYRINSDVAALNAVPEAAITRTAYLPHFAAKAGYNTRVGLVNYTGQRQTIRITAGSLERDGSALSPASVSVERTIPAYGRLEESADSLFSLTGTSLITGYIKWETTGDTRGVIGYLDYGTTDGVLLSAVPAQSTSYSDLFFSHIAEGLGYYTGIAFLNSNTQTTTINIEGFNREGSKIGSATVTLEAGQRRSRLLSELFSGLSTQLGGYVRVTASRPIFAFQLFGSRTSLSFLANVSAQGVQLQPQASGRVVSAATGANVISSDTNSSIAIPPGALSADTTVSLNAVTVTLPPPSSTQRVVASVDAQPSGTKFNIPVRLTFPLAAQLDPGTQIKVLIFTPQGTYEDSGFTAIVDESGRTASAQVTHFTVFAVGLSTDQLITVSSITPTSGLAGTIVTIGGSGFSANAAENIVTFAGPENTSIAATVESATTASIVVKVPAGAITGNMIVKVGSKTSTGVKFTVPADRPKPALSSISPTSLPAGTTSAELRVVGTSFHSASVVRVDGIAAQTTFVDATLLLASLGGSSVVPGVHKVTVYTPPETGASGGGESGPAEYTVGFPVPAITSLSPTSAESASDPVNLTIKGTGFTSSSKVLVNSAVVSSTFVDSTTITTVLTSPEPKNLPIAVSNPTPGGGTSGTAMFTFLEPPVGSITIITTTTSGTVATTIPVEVELKKKNGALLGNFAVSFSITAGNGSVTASATSNAQGRATATLTLGTTAGTNTVKITAGTVTVNFSATGTAGPAAKLNLSASPSSITAGGTGSTVTARIEDQYGNLRNDAVNGVTFTVSSGSGTISASPVTASAGIAATTFTSVTSGSNTIQGAATGLTSGTASVTVGPGAPASLTKTGGDSQTGQAGVALTALKAQVKDTFGNVVPGVTVTFSVVSGGGSVSPASATTNASGEAQTTATPGGSLGTQTFRAASTGLTPVDFNATIAPGPAASITVVSGAATIVAGNSATLTITVLDQFGNVATGATNTLALSANPSGSASFGSTAPALSSGVATTTFGATTARSYTITAASTGVTPGTASVTVSAAAAATIAVSSGNNQTGVKGTNLGSPLVAIVTDAFGNAVSGTSVTFAMSSGGGSVSPSTAQTTGTDGKVSATATLGNVTGTHIFTATSTGLSGSPVSFSASGINAVPAAIVQVGGLTTAAVATTQNFAVQVNDSAGSPIADVNVTFAASAGGGSVSPTVVATGSDGRATTVVTLGNTVGTNTFTATVSGLSAFSANVSSTAGAAASLAKISGDNQTGGVGTALSSPLVVEARDQFGNVKSGVSITFTASSGGGSVSPSTAQNTGTDGRVQVTATLGSAVATHQFTAASTGLTSVVFSATGTLVPATVTLQAGNSQTVAPGISLLTPLKVRVTNAGGIVVPNVTVNWAVASGGGSVSAATSLTDANGDAVITATVGSSAGTNTFTATVTGLTPVTFTATAKTLSASPASVTVNIASGTTQIGSYQVTITYNKDLVTLSSSNVTGGSGAGFTGTPTTVNIDNTAGMVTVNHFQTGNTPSGNFTVATLTFTPIRAGTATLSTSGITVTNTAGNDVSSSFLSLSTTSLTIN